MTKTTTLTQRLSEAAHQPIRFTLALTSEERTRSRHRFETIEGQVVFLQLPRGTVLRDGDVLKSETGELVRVAAKPEPVLTVQAATPLQLLQAAYHLGNRHVGLEITDTYLRFLPDPVLREMLVHRGLQVVKEVQPFQPEVGAYGHGH